MKTKILFSFFFMSSLIFAQNEVVRKLDLVQLDSLKNYLHPVTIIYDSDSVRVTTEVDSISFSNNIWDVDIHVLEGTILCSTSRLFNKIRIGYYWQHVIYNNMSTNSFHKLYWKSTSDGALINIRGYGK